MDYGGHDSIYEDNLVVGYPRKSMCIGFGSFQKGHGHTVRRNRCLVPNSESVIVQLGRCNSTNAKIYDNSYYATTPDKLRAQCSYNKDSIVPFTSLAKDYGIELGSSIHKTPSTITLVEKWAIETLYPSTQTATLHDTAQ